jgi:hypothetical protein
MLAASFRERGLVREDAALPPSFEAAVLAKLAEDGAS